MEGKSQLGAAREKSVKKFCSGTQLRYAVLGLLGFVWEIGDRGLSVLGEFLWAIPDEKECGKDEGVMIKRLLEDKGFFETKRCTLIFFVNMKSHLAHMKKSEELRLFCVIDLCSSIAAPYFSTITSTQKFLT